MRPLDQRGPVVQAHAGTALLPPCMILFLPSAAHCRIRRTYIGIVDGLMVVPSQDEVAPGYFPPEVALDSDAEVQEPLSYDAALSHSIVVLRSEDGCNGAPRSLLCLEVVAALSRHPQLGLACEHFVELLESLSGNGGPSDGLDYAGHAGAVHSCQDHGALFDLAFALAPECWYWRWVRNPRGCCCRAEDSDRYCYCHRCHC